MNEATTMTFEDLERAYETLAQAIDKAGAAHESLFLTRLALVLAHRGGNLKLFEEAVTTALEELAAEPGAQPT